MTKNLRIAIIGAGAIGGVTAGFLARKGHDVEIVCKHGEIADTIRKNGMHVSTPDGVFNAKMKAVENVADLSEKKDMVLIATKTNDAVEAAGQVIPFLSKDATIVSLQNGIVENDIAEVVGPDRVIGCVVGWSATMLGPADVQYTRPADFIIGDMFGLSADKVNQAAAVLENVTSTRISDNILGELYSKLVINCCINSLCALTGQTLGDLLSSKKARGLFIAIMEESIAVADARGISVEPALGGMLDYKEYLSGNDEAARKKRDDTLVFMGEMSKNIKPSSVQSLERGRPTETPWLNGYIIAKAAQTNIPVPINQAAVSLIKQIETNSLPMDPTNLDKIKI